MKLRLMHPGIGVITIPLGPEGLVVGRQGGYSDFEMNWDRRVSRRHARFWIQGGAVWFEDLGSKNGTWDGTRRIDRPERLDLRRVILVGETMFSIAGDETFLPLSTLDLERLDDGSATAQLVDLDGPSLATLPPLLDGIRFTDIIPGAAPALRPAQVAWTEAHRSGSGEPPRSAPGPASEWRPSPATVEPELLPELAIAEPVELAVEPAVEAVERAVEPAAPAPSVFDPAPGDPFFAGDRRVVVRVVDRAALGRLLSDNITKGGLFVATPNPPPRGAEIEVSIGTSGGELTLQAEVVHVVDPTTSGLTGQPAGVGLQFGNVSLEQRAVIQRYAEGHSEKLESAPTVAAAQAPARASVEKALARIKEFLEHVDANDLYGAIGATWRSRPEEVQAAIGALRELVGAVEQNGSPPQVARVHAASKVLDRVAALMSSSDRRIEYEFRKGDVRADERIAAAKARKGPSMSELRGIWHRAMPGRLERAIELLRSAVTAKKARNLIEAVRLGRSALELDPFHEELRQTVDAWARQTPDKTP